LSAALRIRAIAATDVPTSPLWRASTSSISPLLGARSPRALTQSMWERVSEGRAKHDRIHFERQEREVGQEDILTGFG